MPMVSVEQELVNRLQNQIGNLVGQLVMKEIQVDLLLQEHEAHQQIITALGGELPPSQISRAGDNGNNGAQNRGTPATGEALGAARQARSPESELSGASDTGPLTVLTGHRAQEDDSAAGPG